MDEAQIPTEAPLLAGIRAARETLRGRGDDAAAAALTHVIGAVGYAEMKEGQPWSDARVRSLAETTARRLADEAALYESAGDTERAEVARRGVAALEGYRPIRHEGGA
ncbi:hypothetical protein OMK64_05410 [Cellulomonas fimi]|uniref:hypothetical protein n=1 Tax=Cellulomonas fimi TaxID=1708 RepID=UPI00234DD196|nr:hypothetical protein [Cellulomonas fimi]MDC7120967.1 hypothetical protein [Cellulomonas fimi]